MEDRLLSLDEVVKYLKIPKSTLYKLSQRGKIPSVKIGKQLRFRKSSLDNWVSEKEVKFTSQTKESLPTLDQAEPPKPKPRCILLIDDDTLILRTLTRFLKTYGYNVEPAESGEEALAKVEKLNFDLVIADIRMPGIDGIETIKRIREFNHRYNRPKAAEIVITGYMDGMAEQEAERLGITDYIYKPFIINEFIKRVKKKIELNSELN